MSTMIQSVTVLFVALLLTACQTNPIKLTTKSTQYDGLLAQSIVFNKKNQLHQWVCFSEVVQQELTGISCQSDAALPLFSGGLIDGVFEFEYSSRYLLKIKPSHLLAYIKMSIFDELSYDLADISVKKQQATTVIKDLKRKVELIITNL